MIKKDNGFSLLNTILVIAILLVIGLGALWFFDDKLPGNGQEFAPFSSVFNKKSQTETIPTIEGQPVSPLTPVAPDEIQTAQQTNRIVCDTNTAPWLRVTSPNGGETYQAGQDIMVTWQSCNIPLDTFVFASIDNADTTNKIPDTKTNLITNQKNTDTLNDGAEIFTLPANLQGQYKVWIWTNGNIQQPLDIGDSSDNFFTIITNTDPLTTTLPQYVSAQSGWPPAINNETTPMCTTPQNETEKREEKNINGRSYCIKTTSEGAAGSTYNTYYYTSQTSPKKTTSFTLRFVGCSNYDEPQATECKKNQTEFKNGLDYLIDHLMFPANSQ